MMKNTKATRAPNYPDTFPLFAIINSLIHYSKEEDEQEQEQEEEQEEQEQEE